MLKSYAGFSFIEIIISLFLLSCLLLGADEIQLITLQNARSVYYYRLAVQQAQNMAEYLRLGQGCHAEFLERWQQQNQEVLPQGRGVLRETSNQYAISVFWGKEKEQTCRNNHLGLSGCVKMLVSV